VKGDVNELGRYGISLEGKITVVSDLHLEYSEVEVINGGSRKTVSKRVLVKKMLEHLSDSRMIILNGDTAELKWKPGGKKGREGKDNIAKKEKKGLADGLTELMWLFRELKAMGLDSKTVYITGNHDYNIRLFSMPAEVLVTSHCVIATGDTFTLVTHGDIGPYARIVANGKRKGNRKHAVPQDLVKYREALQTKNYPPLPRMEKDWWLVCGHYHNPCRKKEYLVAGLPSMERVVDPERRGHLRFVAIDPVKGTVDLLRLQALESSLSRHKPC